MIYRMGNPDFKVQVGIEVCPSQQRSANWENIE